MTSACFRSKVPNIISGPIVIGVAPSSQAEAGLELPVFGIIAAGI
jgi:hypothetical protein